MRTAFGCLVGVVAQAGPQPPRPATASPFGGPMRRIPVKLGLSSPRSSLRHRS